MKKLIWGLILSLMASIASFGQDFDEFDAPDPDNPAKMAGQRAYYGNDHTPKGHIHVLYVCVQFEEDNFASTTWPSNSLPIWHEDLFYENLSEFNDNNTDLSLSNFYYQNSKFADEPFYVTGEFADLVKVSSSASTGYPSSYNSEVFAQLALQYPDRDWSNFDLRSNHSGSQVYLTDNSNTDPDGDFDYVVVQYRILKGIEGWASDVGVNLPSHTAVASCYSGTINSTQGSWDIIGDGHTHFSDIGFMTARDLFLHEMAHNLFVYGHYGNANGVPGDHMHMTLFWSMMRPNLYVMDAVNAWERYMLKWSDITHDVDETTDTRNPFIIRDFVSTGDAIRIEIPNTGEHLWLEYHSGNSFLDKRNRLLSYGSQTVFPQPAAGVYAYVEDLHDDRETDYNGNAELNGVKIINGDGNYSYIHNNDAIVYPGYWWPAVFTFDENVNIDEPYGGYNPITGYVDDYNQDGEIDYRGTSSQSGALERGSVLREGASEPEGEFTYRFFSMESATLSEGTIYSAFTNPPIINHAHLDANNELSSLKLHNLRVWFFKNGEEIWVHVDYDNEIDRSVDFTNKIEIVSGDQFDIKGGVVVKLRKSNTVNRVGIQSEGFYASSTFTINDNASLLIPANSSFIIEDDSKFILENGSDIDLQGTMHFYDNSELIIRSNALVNLDNGQIVLHDNSKLVIEDYATVENLNISGIGSIELLGNNITLKNSSISLPFTLNKDLTIQGNLYVTNLSILANMEFHGTSGEANTLNVDGNITVGNNVVFEDLTYQNNGGLNIVSSNNITLDDITFVATNVEALINFNDITLSNSTYNQSAIEVNSFSDLTTGYCNISNNNIFNSSNNEAIRVNDFNMFLVKNNTIDNIDGHGIVVYNSGSVSYPAKRIESNTITNNQKNDTAKGILIYNSVVDIYKNTITDNDIGIALFHNSIVSVYGQSTWAEDQKIIDNSLYQVYSSRDSWPWKFEYNEIKETNSVTPRVYHNDVKARSLNIENNCWGDNFDPSSDLWPYRAMDYSPIWDCGGPIGDPILLQDPAQVLYTESLQDIANEDYTSANTKLETIVEEYPNSSYAGDALKTMPVTTSGKSNYDDLINYYQTNSVIQGSEELKLLVGYIIAELKTDEQQFNEALTFYEGIISNPPSDEDYVYALIDAARVYNLAEASGDKAPDNFKFKDLMPKSKEEYTNSSRQYIDGLVKIHKNKTDNNQENNELISGDLEGVFNIYPNPVSSTANIVFTANNTSKATIDIFDVTGKKLYEHHIVAQPGMQKHQISVKDIENGVYFVKVTIGSNSETKRIIITQ
jgi:hypothetical protein